MNRLVHCGSHIYIILVDMRVGHCLELRATTTFSPALSFSLVFLPIELYRFLQCSYELLVLFCVKNDALNK